MLTTWQAHRIMGQRPSPTVQDGGTGCLSAWPTYCFLSSSSAPTRGTDTRLSSAKSREKSIGIRSWATISRNCRTTSRRATNTCECPHKNDLDLGRPLVFEFVRERLPEEYEEVRRYFSKRGAYARFKDLLVRKGALKEWYDFESKAQETALREWCEENSIEITDEREA
jgi:hypothetical protein